MRKAFLLAVITMMVVFLSGCKPIFEVDTQILQEQIYEPTAVKYSGLKTSTVLYLDHSTCVIDAVRNSPVFRAMRPNLGQYSDTLVLIKGISFQVIPLFNKGPNSEIYQVLTTIQNDIPYADILTHIDQICKSHQQAILITDCEYFYQGISQDQNPYLSRPLKNWLEEGHSIYIITEPYLERYQGKPYDKKRFYIIFTDDRMPAPISHNLLGEIQHLLQNGTCTLFKMTNSDLKVESPKSDMVDANLSFNVEYFSGFEYVSIDDSWEDIREYVMKLDKYGEPLPQEEPEPLIKNLIINDGENFIIEDIQIMATNITSKYLALEDSTVSAKEINISDGFILDKEALQNYKLNVRLTDKIFTDGYLSDEFGGNLIRLDFVISIVSLKPYDAGLFEWQSLYSSQSAICVSKSIDNALSDVNVIPTNPNRRVLHTVFIKTEAYK